MKCYGCEKRRVGCHSVCKEYLAEKAEKARVDRIKRQSDVSYEYAKESIAKQQRRIARSAR